MAMNYIPNDPRATAASTPISHTPRNDRPASKAGFNYFGGSPEGRYAVGTPEFLFWQCSEGALAAMEAWDELDGPLNRWVNGRQHLDLRQNQGVRLNAFYDRRSVQFFQFNVGSATAFSGASVDVVAHEVGHGLLDAIRPDLWDSPFLEVGAYHEAFGDCVALLAAVQDSRQRSSLLAELPDLWGENFIETTAEELSAGIRAVDSTHNAARPRHAFNYYNWQLPSTLPIDGGPGELIAEEHSFAQVFTGAFWDLIILLFQAGAATSARLEDAARTAGRLLVAATPVAPEKARFFQSVGQFMVLADQDQNGGDNEDLIRTAFAWHGMELEATMLAPTSALAGSMARAGAVSRRMSAGARGDLAQRLGAAPGEKLRMVDCKVGARRFVKAVHERAVSLGSVHPSLRGISVLAPEPVLLGRSGARAVVLGAVPEAAQTHDEVRCYVKSLLKRNRIDLGRKKGAAPEVYDLTHAVKEVGGRRVLKKLRVNCCDH